MQRNSQEKSASAATSDSCPSQMMEALEDRQMMSAAPLASPSLTPSHTLNPGISVGAMYVYAPSGLSASASSPVSVSLAWTNNDAGATGFLVQRSLDGRTYTSIAVVNSGSQTSYTDTTAIAGRNNYYRVRTIKGSAYSSYTPIAGVAMTPMVAPSGLSVSATAPNAVALSWTNNESVAAGYVIQRSYNGKTFATIATINSASTTSYNDTSALAGWKIYYRVCAINGASASGYTAVSSATTAPMGVPSGLAATANSPVSVSLEWTNNEAITAGYVVQRSLDGKKFLTIATIASADTTTYTDNAAIAGWTNIYRVCAVAGQNASAYGNWASLTTAAMAAPSGVTANASAPNTVSVSWTNNEPVAAGFIVQRSLDGYKYSTIATLGSAATTTYTDTAAASGRANYYRVIAVTGASASAASVAGSAVTPMASSTGLVASAVTALSVKLTWARNDVAATGVYVWRSTDGVNFTKIATLGKVLTFTDSTVSPSSTYQYMVQCFNANVAAAVSTAATAITPLGPVVNATVTATGLTQATLNWTNTDANATGIYVLRSLDGKTWTRLATLSDGTTSSYTDYSVVSGGTYFYVVQAFNANAYASGSATMKIYMPVGAVSGLNATATGPNAVALNWTNTDLTVTGYKVFRSLDGKKYTLLSSFALPLTSTFTDASALSGRRYYYMVQAYKGTLTSAASAPVATVTPLVAPANLIANASGLSVSLSWTRTDASATGYYVLRSLDGSTFTTVATIKSGLTTTYTDSQLTGDQTYTYKVQAFSALATSAVSSAATATPNGTSVTISTRYGNELVITAIGSNDTISLSQSGSIITILADGKTTTATAPAGGIFVYTRGGASTISVASSVTLMTTVESIDAASTTINSSGSHVSLWIDSTDSFTGTGTVHRVANFAAGISKLTGAAMNNPTDAGAVKKASASLWGTGPVLDDVNQGSIGDCYFLASLAAYAGFDPSALRETAVDMGDGTFAVQYVGSNGVTSFIRVSNDFSIGGFSGGYKFAHPGATGAIWTMVLEKAFCYFRTGANTYASISGGWMGSAYSILGIGSSTFASASYSDDQMYSLLVDELADGPVTLATQSAPNMVSYHAYQLVGVTTDANGVHQYTVRNPWGCKGAAPENAAGYATLTYAQFKANFLYVCVAA